MDWDLKSEVDLIHFDELKSKLYEFAKNKNSSVAKQNEIM
jgi:hypothetical protein